MSQQVMGNADNQTLAEGRNHLNLTEFDNQNTHENESNFASVSKGVTVDQSFRKQDSRMNRTVAGKFLKPGS